MFNSLKKTIKNATIMRWKLGFNPEETYSLDYSICKFVLPRLKYFQKTKKAHPVQYTEQQWTDIVEKMITAFQLMDDSYDDCFLIKEEDEQTIKEGLRLFSENFLCLWW